MAANKKPTGKASSKATDRGTSNPTTTRAPAKPKRKRTTKKAPQATSDAAQSEPAPKAQKQVSEATVIVPKEPKKPKKPAMKRQPSRAIPDKLVGVNKLKRGKPAYIPTPEEADAAVVEGEEEIDEFDAATAADKTDGEEEEVVALIGEENVKDSLDPWEYEDQYEKKQKKKKKKGEKKESGDSTEDKEHWFYRRVRIPKPPPLPPSEASMISGRLEIKRHTLAKIEMRKQYCKPGKRLFLKHEELQLARHFKYGTIAQPEKEAESDTDHADEPDADKLDDYQSDNDSDCDPDDELVRNGDADYLPSDSSGKAISVKSCKSDKSQSPWDTEDEQEAIKVNMKKARKLVKRQKADAAKVREPSDYGDESDLEDNGLATPPPSSQLGSDHDWEDDDEAMEPKTVREWRAAVQAAEQRGKQKAKEEYKRGLADGMRLATATPLTALNPNPKRLSSRSARLPTPPLRTPSPHQIDNAHDLTCQDHTHEDLAHQDHAHQDQQDQQDDQDHQDHTRHAEPTPLREIKPEMDSVKVKVEYNPYQRRVKIKTSCPSPQRTLANFQPRGAQQIAKVDRIQGLLDEMEEKGWKFAEVYCRKCAEAGFPCIVPIDPFAAKKACYTCGSNYCSFNEKKK